MSAATYPVTATIAELVGVIDTVASEVLPASRSKHRFIELASSTGSLRVDVPRAWGQQEISNLLADQTDATVGVVALAAPDVSRFYNEWDTAGIFVGVHEDPRTLEGGLERRTSFYEQNCVLAGENGVRNVETRGRYRIWVGCGATDTITVEYDTTRDVYGTSLTARLVDRADVEAIERALRSLEVTPPLVLPGESPTDDRDGDLAPGLVTP